MKFEMLQKLTAMMFEPDGAGGIRQRYDSVDVRTLSPLVAAYVGDAYFHLFVRGRLLSYEQNKVQVLNRFSAQIVSAVWQAKAYTAIEPMLTDEEKVMACRAAKAAGASFVKTSTGFSTGGARPEDVALMRKAVGEGMGVKASGGIHTAEEALACIRAGATRLGVSAGIAVVNGIAD